jgi:hypothetical protein
MSKNYLPYMVYGKRKWSTMYSRKWYLSLFFDRWERWRERCGRTGSDGDKRARGNQWGEKMIGA